MFTVLPSSFLCCSLEWRWAIDVWKCRISTNYTLKKVRAALMAWLRFLLLRFTYYLTWNTVSLISWSGASQNPSYDARTSAALLFRRIWESQGMKNLGCISQNHKAHSQLQPLLLLKSGSRQNQKPCTKLCGVLFSPNLSASAIWLSIASISKLRPLRVTSTFYTPWNGNQKGAVPSSFFLAEVFIINFPMLESHPYPARQ